MARPPTRTGCSKVGCEAKHYGLGLCRVHYKAEWWAKNYGNNAAAQNARVRAWEQRHPERARLVKRASYLRNKDRQLALEKQRRTADPRKYSARVRAAQEAHPETRRAAKAARRAAELRATPKWANKFFMSEAHHLAILRTEKTGYEWHVDHIVPLQHPLVCGLHVEHNLQVIPASVNRSKSNLRWPDMPAGA